MDGEYGSAPFIIACCYLATSLVGIIGNTISILIFTHPRMRRSSINVLLASLSISDLCLLVLGIFAMGLPPLLPSLVTADQAESFQAYSAVSCYPLSVMAQTSSCWILILITVERFLAVCLPLTALRACTPKRAKTAVAFVVCLAVMYNFVRFYEYQIQYNEEQNKTVAVQHLANNSVYIQIYVSTMYTIFIFMLPFLFLLTMNIYVIIALKRSQRNRETLTRHQVTERKTTVMMVVVIVLFLSCNLAPNLINFAQVIIPNFFVGATTIELAFLLMDISNFGYIINCTLNPFVYYYFSDRYRKVFLELIRCHYNMRSKLDTTQGTALRTTAPPSPYIGRDRSKDLLYDERAAFLNNDCQTPLTEGKNGFAFD